MAATAAVHRYRRRCGGWSRKRASNMARVPASGPGGRITKGDVLAYLEAPSGEAAVGKIPPPAAAEPSFQAPVAAATGPRETRERMSTLRQRIAERLVEVQQTAAILTTFNEADMSRVIALRKDFKDAFQKKHGVALGFMSFFIKASIAALRAYQAVNARIDGSEIVYHNYVDIGVAVSTERGLMVPVIKRRRPADVRGARAGRRGVRGQGARGNDHGRRSQGGHVHDHQRRHLRLAPVNADPEPAAKRDSGHARDQESAGRRR